MQANSDVLVYGAGAFGAFVARSMAEVGVNVVGIVDDSPSVGHSEDVLTSQDAAERFPGATVLLGVYNPGADVMAIQRRLADGGFADVRSPLQVMRAIKELGGDPQDQYWMTADENVVPDQVDRAADLQDKLTDERSRMLLESIMRFRARGELADCPVPDLLAEQYMPHDVAFLSKRMRWVDLGAYTGDTIENLIELKADVEAVLAFEPDGNNFRELAQFLSEQSGLESLPLPLGVSDDLKQVSFVADGSSGAHESAAGDVTVQCISLDLLLMGWRPTHVKADIEGAEMASLRGMTKTLEKYRPRLAISVYHKPADLFEVPEFLDSLQLDYEMYLRTYGFQTFDTVLYAVPR